MPKVQPKAVLEPSDIRAAMRVAIARGPEEAALIAWMYEFGARAAEPGLLLLKDVDLRSRRARPTHLKSGQAQDWHSLLPYCRKRLPLWLEERGPYIQVPQQQDYMFPSGTPGRCYTCKGSGQRPVLRLDKKTGKRKNAEHIPCHHCTATGKRWGLSRFEVHNMVGSILKESGAPHHHPHVLRHSIITHLLEGGMTATVIQDRVGHRNLSTTLGYAHATKAAAAQLESALSDVYGEDPDDDT